MTIKEMRNGAQLTVSDVCSAVAMSEKTLKNWEAGKVPAAVTALPAIAALYGVSIEDLVLALQPAKENTNSRDGQER